MIIGINNNKIYENFTVVNESNELVSGISPSGFFANLFNPSGSDVTSQIEVNIIELENGHYRAEFTPNMIGTWYLVVYHSIYFPWGKSDDIQVYQSDFDKISENLLEILGLVHQNISIDQTGYDKHGNLSSARVRIYSNAGSVGTNNDVIGTYKITSSGSETGKFTTWSQVKI